MPRAGRHADGRPAAAGDLVRRRAGCIWAIAASAPRRPRLPAAGPAHEFHYATTLRAEGPPLFAAADAEGAALPPMGLTLGRVAGSFAHLIDRAC